MKTSIRLKTDISPEIRNKMVIAALGIRILPRLTSELNKVSELQDQIELTEEQQYFIETQNTVTEGSGEIPTQDELEEPKGDFAFLTWREHCEKHANGDEELIELINGLDENGYSKTIDLSDHQVEQLKELGNKAGFVGLGSKDIRECWLAHLQHHHSQIDTDIDAEFFNRAKQYLENKSAFDEFASAESETYDIKKWAKALEIKGKEQKAFEKDCIELYNLVDAPPIKDQYMEEDKAILRVIQNKYGDWELETDLLYDSLDAVTGEIDFTSLNDEDRRNIDALAEDIFDQEYALYQRVGNGLSKQLAGGKDIDKLRSPVLRDFRDNLEEFIQERKDRRKEDPRLNLIADFVDDNQIREFERQIVKIVDKDKKVHFATFKQLMRK